MPISSLGRSGRVSQKFSLRSTLPTDANTLWQIDQGVVRSLTFGEDGTLVVLGLWGPGDCVGQPISCRTPSELECITPVQATALRSPDWQGEADLLRYHLQQLEELTMIRSYRRMEERLVRLLVWLSDRFGEESSLGSVINFRLTHQDIADLLGTTRVTVTRLLNQLEKQGTIERPSIRKIILKEIDCWYYQI